MRVEITRELDAGDPMLEIPWRGINPRVRYRDLKQKPSSLARISECKEFPTLKFLLKKVNARGSGLRSAKCDAWRTNELAEDERLDFDTPWKTAGFVDIVLERAPSAGSLTTHIRFAEKVADKLCAFHIAGQMEIVIRRCLLRAANVRGYALTFFIHAYGATPRESDREWARAIEALAHALDCALT